MKPLLSFPFYPFHFSLRDMFLFYSLYLLAVQYSET